MGLERGPEFGQVRVAVDAAELVIGFEHPGPTRPPGEPARPSSTLWTPRPPTGTPTSNSPTTSKASSPCCVPAPSPPPLKTANGGLRPQVTFCLVGGERDPQVGGEAQHVILLVAQAFQQVTVGLLLAAGNLGHWGEAAQDAVFERSAAARATTENRPAGSLEPILPRFGLRFAMVALPGGRGGQSRGGVPRHAWENGRSQCRDPASRPPNPSAWQETNRWIGPDRPGEA
jgi:hypothetical protein